MTMTSIFLSSLSISGEEFINKKKKTEKKKKMKLCVFSLFCICLLKTVLLLDPCLMTDIIT